MLFAFKFIKMHLKHRQGYQTIALINYRKTYLSKIWRHSNISSNLDAESKLFFQMWRKIPWTQPSYTSLSWHHLGNWEYDQVSGCGVQLIGEGRGEGYWGRHTRPPTELVPAGRGGWALPRTRTLIGGYSTGTCPGTWPPHLGLWGQGREG